MDTTRTPAGAGANDDLLLRLRQALLRGRQPQEQLLDFDHYARNVREDRGNTIDTNI